MKLLLVFLSLVCFPFSAEAQLLRPKKDKPAKISANNESKWDIPFKLKMKQVSVTGDLTINPSVYIHTDNRRIKLKFLRNTLSPLSIRNLL